ncbi:MAG: hypothetical protein H0V73_04585 [Chloroflexi bacterium]|nr:hypothetical protein [Chloroflexota bacterium]
MTRRVAVDADLQSQLDKLAGCPPPKRIGLREDILAFGVASVEPLAALVVTMPDLASSVSAWLELLATRDPEARPAARTALRRLAAHNEGSIAQQALERLKEADKAMVAARSRTTTAS